MYNQIDLDRCINFPGRHRQTTFEGKMIDAEPRLFH